MRMAIASPGNDFRLGACEAPPAIISTYLGEQLTTFLKEFKEGKTGQTYTPAKATIDLPYGGKIKVPAEDRNRTSPFPYMFEPTWVSCDVVTNASRKPWKACGPHRFRPIPVPPRVYPGRILSQLDVEIRIET